MTFKPCSWCLLLLLLPHSKLAAETLVVALYEGSNPPYSILIKDKRSGIFIDMFDYLSSVTGHTFVFKDYPLARVLREFDGGGVDIEPGINEAWRQHVKVAGIYSISYENSKEVIVFRQGKSFPVNSPVDLYGKTVGLVRGYSFPEYDAAFKSKRITRLDNRSEKLLLHQLLLNRVQQIFIGDRTIRYYKKYFPEFKNLVIGDIVSHVEVKLRIHPRKAHLLTEINAALQQMTDSGKLSKIYDDYR